MGVEGFVTAVVDMYPTYIRKGRRREMLIGVICLLCFLIGLSMVTQVSGPFCVWNMSYTGYDIFILPLCFFSFHCIGFILTNYCLKNYFSPDPLLYINFKFKMFSWLIHEGYIFHLV